jgi:two-component system response regulator HydG
MKKTAGIEKILIVDSDTDYFDGLSKGLMHLMHKDNRLEVLYSANEEKTLIRLKENPDIKLVLIDDSIKRHESEHISSYITNHLKTKILIISGRAGNNPEPEVINKSDLDSIKTRIIAQLDDYDKFAKDSEISKTSSRREMEYLMGKGKVISKVLDRVEKYAKTDKPVLIEGETGTGKELIADYLHRLSARKNMITVNCGILSKELAACELFGSAKGAFTDAQDRKGKVEAADGGILYLDELNSLSPDVQVKFLRFIESGTYTRVGDTVEHRANVRIIAAGNESFQKLVEEGKFRQDLFERFVRTVYVPALKERIEDIDYFIDRFIAEENKAQGKTASISNEARKLLTGHDWPGNIRQLKNFIATLLVEVEADSHSKEDIVKSLLVQERFDEKQQKKTGDSPKDDSPEEDYTLRTACETAHDNAAEKAVRRALIKTGGNNGRAIKLLDISRGTYYSLKKKFGIE